MKTPIFKKTLQTLSCTLLAFSHIALHSPATSNESRPQNAFPFKQDFISHPDTPENRIEFFYLMPQGPGPFPVLFLLTGWQPKENSKGGKELVEFGYLNRLVGQGIAAVSISAPGFGNTDGNRDFAGPNSQRAVCAVIDHFRSHPNIDPTRMGLYGISKGASIGSMVSSLYPELKLQILESGLYDLTKPWPMPEYLHAIHDNLLIESGTSPEAFIARSAVYHADKVKAATLILHGEFDDRRGLPTAQDLHENLKSSGVDSILKVYPNTAHGLEIEKWEDIMRFLRYQFFNTCGIGIKITELSPAIQIIEIFPGSNAERSKLRLGDAILRVSPNNDDQEIDVLRMPRKDLTALILGQPGTSVRLHVQHFDQTYEEVVVERGFTR